MIDLINDPKFVSDLATRLKNKTIFLTGGTGFFGRNFIAVMTVLNTKYALNLKIYVLARDPEKFKSQFPQLQSNILFYQKGDIQNFEFVSKKIDYILHFATPASSTLNIENPLSMFDNIINGSRRILDFAVANKCEKFLFASSGAVYGKQPTEITHLPESYVGAPLTQFTHSAYGEAKRAAELLGNIYSDKYGFEHKIARCFAFVGPHLDPNGTYAIGNFIRDALQGKKIVIGGDGTPFRSYLFSVDLVFWLLAVLLNGRNKQPYNVGSDSDLSILEVAKTVAQTLSPNLEIVVSKTPTNPTKPDRYVPDVKLAQSELGVKVWTPLLDSIRYTAEAYKNSQS